MVARGTPSKSAERLEGEAWVRLGMELLDPMDRDVIVLRRWNELSFPEIGEHLGLSPNTARMKYNRAVLKLGDEVMALRRGDLSRFVEGDSFDKGES
jgi:DNA-directed RNA polymerase specialized sigma24 family protein